MKIFAFAALLASITTTSCSQVALENPEVKGITRFACYGFGPNHVGDETAICYFRPVKTPLSDFTTAEQRASKVRSEHAMFCKKIIIVRDTPFTSNDSPPIQLRRVGFRCDRRQW